MKCLHLTLSFAKFRGGREALTNGLSVDLASEAEVWAVPGLVRLMAMAAWFSATALDSRDGAAAKITQIQDLHQNAGTQLFEGGEGLRQGGLLS